MMEEIHELAFLTLLRARQKFMDDYCRSRGWQGRELTAEQIMEIRAARGWQIPMGE